VTVQTTYPGVYVIEQPSGSHVIAGVSTSVTAFVGAARMGEAEQPVPITSYAQFQREFGDPIDTDHPMGYAVGHFFSNGGSQAIVVRALPGTAATAALHIAAVDGVSVSAAAMSPGAWANGVKAGTAAQSGLFAQVLASTTYPDDRFNLVITQWAAGPAGGAPSQVAQETWTDLSLSRDNPRFVETVLAASLIARVTVDDSAPTGAAVAGSSTGSVDLPADPGTIDGLVGTVLRVAVDGGTATDYTLFGGQAAAGKTAAEVVTEIAARLGAAATVALDGAKLKITSATDDLNSAVVVGLSGADDASIPLGLGVAMGGTEISGSAGYLPAPMADPAPLTGGTDGGPVGSGDILNSMSALDVLNFPRFNLLCLPGVTTATADVSVVASALDYCRRQNAFLLIDPEPGVAGANLNAKVGPLRGQGQHGAVYWPRLVTSDSGPGGLPPCGAVAGVMARTDGERGVWKAPAGMAAGLSGILGTVFPTDDGVSGTLNPQGLNVLRTFPSTGLVIWGTRTLAGSDNAPSADFKYVPVRRLTDYLSASLYEGTQFAVFEPNDPVLWGQLRLAVGAFMRTLFHQGAFQQSEKHAESDSFFVTCDSTVNPQSEIDAGRVNIVVGFAPLKPAEFVVITITQLSQAGD
jgi:uncharacterized protein